MVTWSLDWFVYIVKLENEPHPKLFFGGGGGSNVGHCGLPTLLSSVDSKIQPYMVSRPNILRLQHACTCDNASQMSNIILITVKNNKKYTLQKKLYP